MYVESSVVGVGFGCGCCVVYVLCLRDVASWSGGLDSHRLHPPF